MELKRIEVNEVLCDVIATWHDEETNKEFIIYTDNKYTQNKLNVYYGLYTEQNGKIKVSEIIDEKDEKIALEVIKEIISSKQLYEEGK